MKSEAKSVCRPTQGRASVQGGGVFGSVGLARLEGWTYGRQLVVRRHRRNRPCTYPSYRHFISNCTFEDGRVWFLAIWTPGSRLSKDWDSMCPGGGIGGGDRIGTATGGLMRPKHNPNELPGEQQRLHVPIVNDESSNFLCKRTNELAKIRKFGRLGDSSRSATGSLGA